jgi:hypothetical protein
VIWNATGPPFVPSPTSLGDVRPATRLHVSIQWINALRPAPALAGSSIVVVVSSAILRPISCAVITDPSMHPESRKTGERRRGHTLVTPHAAKGR